MKFIGAILVFFLSSVDLLASSPVQAIYIDPQTENYWKSNRSDRLRLADLVNRLAGHRAKALVIKLFMSRSHSENRDSALSKSFKNIPTFLQASLIAEKKDIRLNPRFHFNGKVEGKFHGFGGDLGSIPLSVFQENSACIGFVDQGQDPDYWPVLQQYQGHLVRSLQLCILESIYGPAKINLGKSISMNGKTVGLNKFNQIELKLKRASYPKYISALDFIKGSVKKDMIEGKIIILGYRGPNIHKIETSMGKLQAHEMFFNYLMEAIDVFR